MNNRNLIIREILPKAGLVYSEKSSLSEILCKPKIMPLKSITLEKIETLEKELSEKGFIPEKSTVQNNKTDDPHSKMRQLQEEYERKQAMQQ